MIKRFFILSSLCIFLGVSAQKTHTVTKGDNPYSIAKRYGMTVDELLKLNPKFKDGKLAIGDVLAVKSDKSTPSVTKTVVADKVEKPNSKQGKIVLQPKQTIYGITKQYRISETDLRKLNPELDSHMKIGDEITLPLESIKKYGGEQQAVAVTAKPVEAVVEKPAAPVATGESYTIQSKDNYYKISKQFGVSQQELFTLNPGLEEKGLKPGETIIVKKIGSTTTAAVSEKTNTKTTIDSGSEKSSANISSNTGTASVDDYVTYTVEQGDTVFSIVNKFGVSIDDLIALNPDLSHGLKSGMVLKIKKLDPVYSKKNGDALSVVLMLPFGYSTNETQYRSMAIDFLTGAKLAIERNARNGQKLDIKIVDSGNEASFRNSLTQINPNNTDLIIGPFFKSNVVDVLDFIKNQKIPVVAPFANSPELYNYSNLIIVETNDQVYADKIVDEVKAVYSDQKIYIVADSKKENANYIKSGLEKAVKNPNVIIVNSPADIQLDQNMMTGQSAPVIAVLANDNDTAGEAFSNKIIALSKEVQGVKAFSMFYTPSFEKKVDDLSQASLVYLMDRKINTDGSFEKEILAAYKSKYCKTPPKYAIVGFDVVNDMLTRENKKGEISRQMNKVQTQLATKFEFVKPKANGAYVNTGYRVIRLVP